MSQMKHWLEQIAVEMGEEGEISDAVLEEARGRLEQMVSINFDEENSQL